MTTRLKFIAPVSLSSTGPAATSLYEVYLSTAGQVLFYTVASFVVNSHQLNVYRNGVLQYVGSDYLEVNSNTIQFTKVMQDGEAILFTTQSTFSSILHEEYTALPSQVRFTLASNYHPDLKTLFVFVNGQMMQRGVDYLETSSNEVTFTAPLSGGQIVTFHEQV